MMMDMPIMPWRDLRASKIKGDQIKEVSTTAQLSTGVLLVLSSNLNLPSFSLMMDTMLQSDGTLHGRKSLYWEHVTTANSSFLRLYHASQLVCSRHFLLFHSAQCNIVNTVTAVHFYRITATESQSINHLFIKTTPSNAQITQPNAIHATQCNQHNRQLNTTQ